MFQQRLTWFWIGLMVFALAIIGRLAQIQVADAAEYERLAERILTRKPIYIAAPRGAIRDLAGRPLVSDEPAADVRIHYAVLAGRPDVLRAYLIDVAKAYRQQDKRPRDMRLTDIAAELEAELPAMWARLSALSGVPEWELQLRVQRINARVDRWRANAKQPIREESQLLPVLEDVDQRVALAVRMELEPKYPWLRVLPGARRVAHADADPLVHVVGRLGAASPDRIAADPLAGDELRCLRADERCGIAGLERLAETSLRGQRGRIVQNFSREVIERVEPTPGRDVQLTIDAELQRYVYDLLAQAVAERPETHRAGAAAVVIDVASREVRALVSYPAYSFEDFNAQYEQLQRDPKQLPLMFRAVQAQYPPGSICKAVTLIGGLSDGVINADTRIHCTGFLRPEAPDHFRCWIYNLNPGLTHDITDTPAGQDGASAVKNSCNIFFYKVGERLGAARLCEWFTNLGLGRRAGTGLVEEVNGVVPNEDYLKRTAKRGFQPSDAWNFAIGQGEVTITPLQAANVAASIASGQWAPVRLAYDSAGHGFGLAPEQPVPLADRHLQVLRRGMWRSVNERGGTGAPARLTSDEYELCGKTGSAQAQPRPIAYRYTFEWPDGSRREAVGYLEEDARAELNAPDLKCVGRHCVARFPQLEEGAKLPAHAWFMGFTESTRTARGEKPRGPVYAISVVIEYGESGGKMAGPVARKIAERLLELAPAMEAAGPAQGDAEQYGEPQGDD
jgi:cell division protein FtsI/penicillin-binding protein 2